MQSGVLTRCIFETPLAVLDCETTGLHPGADRIVELAVVRKEPGQTPDLVLDTLVNPHRPMAATEIHGITDEDVRGAPDFQSISSDLARVLAGCVVTSYNVYFDMRFLREELGRVGVWHDLPHVCLMYMRPMLGLGPKRPLRDACAEHGVPHENVHIAASDAQAASRLMEVYLRVLREKGLQTFEQLTTIKNYKFLTSLRCEPLPQSTLAGQGRKTPLKPRSPMAAKGSSALLTERKRLAVATYWDALGATLADLDISDEEDRFLERKRAELRLAPEQIRMLHARAFAAAISGFTDDQWLDENECEKLRHLYECLGRLGWAPGQ